MTPILRIQLAAPSAASAGAIRDALASAGLEAEVTVVDTGGPPPAEPAVSAEALERLQQAELRQRALLESLAEAEARYRDLVEEIPAVTYIADFDETANLRYVSPQIEPLLGYAPREFIHDQDLWYRLIHPDDRERVRREESRVVREVQQFDYEYRMTARDGREVWVWDKDTLIRDETGTPLFTRGILVDITALRRTELALRAERDRAQTYLDMAGAVIVALDLDQRVKLLNRAGHELLGYRDGELNGRDWFETVVPEAEREQRRERFRRVVAGRGELAAERFEGTFLTREGSERILAWHMAAVHDDEGHVTGAVASGVDVTERRRAEQQIAYLAYHDSLTGLPNRALLQEHLELALARARRHGHAVALLYLDLDDFKLVNDSLGHSAGDDVLCHVAMRLSDRCRDMDLLARQGGDEFLVLLSDLEQDAVTAARQAAAGALSALDEPFLVADAEFGVGASVGISVFPADAADAETLLRHADAAMYEAKARGRNAVAVYSADSEEPLERLSMTSRLRKAVAADDLLLHWQPIVSPADGSLYSVEALVRWNDPARGLLRPRDFIGFAEETGLIDRVGEWVIDAICAQRLAWRAEGFDPAVMLNVSARQLQRPELAAHLCSRLEGHGLDPARMTVEVTESVAMQDPATTEPILRDLHAAGIRVAIDDFGAGYSSLARLRQLPVQMLKIDQSFLRDVPGSAEAAAVVTAIVDLSTALGMVTVAEGVETEAQRRFLVEHGCPLAQGYLFSRPGPARMLEPFLRRARGADVAASRIP
jgi:diguanylate cyclase (GGDEF)-like protein/PAS domain S-box-containing protein